MQELEWKTRKTRIDARLTATRPPWKIVPYRADLDPPTLDRCAVTEFPTTHGPADYALFVHGRWLGIIEAKKVGVGPQNVLEQARRYSRGATQGVGNWNGLHVPFLYATNGEVFWSSDERLPQPLSSPVSSLPSPDALEDRFSRDLVAASAQLQGTALHHIERIRPYQEKCIAAAESPLLTAEERVTAAFARLEARLILTADQRKWMLSIREHLLTSLSLSEEDFDDQPIFSSRGGRARAKILFGQDLPTLIHRINEAVAA